MLKNIIKLLPVLLLSLMFFSFEYASDTRQILNWSNQLLSRVYDPSGEVKLKKWELSITDDYFLRLRKTYQNGKQEYYSCQLRRFNEMDYVGTNASGFIKISTAADNIIVQTYNDRKGDIDSMTTAFTIPVKNIEPEQIDSLRSALLYFKTNPPATGR